MQVVVALGILVLVISWLFFSIPVIYKLVEWSLEWYEPILNEFRDIFRRRRVR